MASRRNFIAQGLGAVGAVALTVGSGRSLAQTQAPKTVFLSLSKGNEPFMVKLRTEAEDEARRLNVRLLFNDGKGDSSVQASALEQAVSTGKVDAVVIAPNDVHVLVPAVNLALRQGLQVVTLDRQVVGTMRPVPHIGVDNTLGGKLMAGWVVQQFPKGANVLHLTGQPGSSTAIDRARGVREGLAAAGAKYKIVADISANWSRSEAMLVTEGQLSFLKPPPDVIVAANDDMAVGAIEAIRSLGLRPRGIQVIGYDALPFALQRIRDGDMGATVDQQVEQMSRTALRKVAAALRGGPPVEGVLLAPTLVTAASLKASDATGTTRP